MDILISDDQNIGLYEIRLTHMFLTKILKLWEAFMLFVDSQRIAIIAIKMIGDALSESVNAVVYTINCIVDTFLHEVAMFCALQTSSLPVIN